jgi:hypothetical protein
LSGYRLTPVEFDIDLAKDVAAWQSANHREPADLADLLAALRHRIAHTIHHRDPHPAPEQDGSIHAEPSNRIARLVDDVEILVDRES